MKITCSVVLFTAALTLAQTNNLDSHRDEMNGIHLKDYLDFEKKWKMVTVRFRKDTSEMRWTFGNEIALQTLQSGGTIYPDGSVFAKIGIRTNEDPQFASSAVPTGARRYQFMVRDSIKYASTGGWGYALFDIDGHLFPEDPTATSQACFACHQIVKNRGQVFSQPFILSPFVKTAFLSHGDGFQKIQFKNIPYKKIPKLIQKYIPANFLNLRQVEKNKITASIFQGTLDEMKPSLEIEAMASRLPALFISDDQKRFTLVIPSESTACKPGRFFKTVMTLENADKPTLETEYCNP